MKRIAHFVLGLDEDASEELLIDHKRALQSMESAAEEIPAGWELRQFVTIVDRAIKYSSAFLPVRLATDAKSLDNARLPRLPRAQEVFNALATEEAQLVVLTNADICLSADFYKSVISRFENGVTSFSINRRTIDAPIPKDVDPIHWGRMQPGRKHPGSDCFVSTPLVCQRMILGDTYFGLPGIGNLVLLNLALNDGSFTRFREDFLTFHFGDLRPWKADSRHNFRVTNERRLADVVVELRRKNGNQKFQEALSRSEISPKFPGLADSFTHKFRARRLLGALLR